MCSMADSVRPSSMDEGDTYDVPPSRTSFGFPGDKRYEIPPSLPPKKNSSRMSIQDALGLSRVVQEPRPTPRPRGTASPKGAVDVEIRSPTSPEGQLQTDAGGRPRPRPRPRTRSSKYISRPDSEDNFPPNADEIEAMITAQVEQEMEAFEVEYAVPKERASEGTSETLFTKSMSSLPPLPFSPACPAASETEAIYFNQDTIGSPCGAESEDESMYINAGLLKRSVNSQSITDTSSTLGRRSFDSHIGSGPRQSDIVEEEYSIPTNVKAKNTSLEEHTFPHTTQSPTESAHEMNLQTGFGGLELNNEEYARVKKIGNCSPGELDPFIVSRPLHMSDAHPGLLQPTKVWKTRASEAGEISETLHEESSSEEEYEAVWLSGNSKFRQLGMVRPKSDLMVFSPKPGDKPAVPPSCGQQLGEYVELDSTYNIPPPARTPPPLPDEAFIVVKPPSVPPRPLNKNPSPSSYITLPDNLHVKESSTDSRMEDEPSSAVFTKLETPGFNPFPDDPFKYSGFVMECQEFNTPCPGDTSQGGAVGTWPGDAGGCEWPSDFTATFPDAAANSEVGVLSGEDFDTYSEISPTAGLQAKSDSNFRLSSVPPPPPRGRPSPTPTPAARKESPGARSNIYSVAYDLETEGRESFPADESSDSSDDQFTYPSSDFNPGDRYSGVSGVPIIPPSALIQRKQERCGYLHKQGGVKANKGWKLRWVVFNGKDLRYYDSNKSQISKKIIPLSSMEEVKTDIQKGETTRFRFNLVTTLRNRVFVFGADTKDDCCQWASTLMAAIIKNKSSSPEERSKPDKEGFVKFDNNNRRYYVAISGDMFRYYDSFQDFELNSPVHEIEMKLSSVKDTKKSRLQLSTHYAYFILAFESPQEAQGWRMAIEDAIAEGLADDSVLDKVYENASNQICADCSDSNPHWASINLGIVLCKKCAGIHRMFETSLTKIRSLRMDTRVWTPSLIELMKAIGNSNANQFWEHNLSIKKPTKDSFPDERRKFAMSKYQHRSFCNKHPQASDKKKLNEMLLEVASTNNLKEAMQIIFSGADVTYTRGGEKENAYNIAKQHGQRLLMELLYQNGGDRAPGEGDGANEEGRLREDVRLQGFLLKTGPVGRTFDSRWCVLEHGALTYYLNDKSTTAKDSIDRKSILCLQEVASDRQESVFEISTSKGSNRVYLFAAESHTDRGMWMRAISKLIAPVAVMEHVGMMDFSLAALVFMRESVSEDWQPAWIMLSWRLLYYMNKDLKLDNVDLRKASHIKMQDPQTGSCPLCTEKAGCLVVGSPGKWILYIQANLSRDTNRIFDAVSAAIKMSGTSLLEQQLTSDNVPVIIDKCLNQIYARGVNEEGIYRKSATQSRVIQLLEDLRKDARGVRLDDCDIHEVASCIKRFLRELDDSLFTCQLYNEWIHTSQITDHNNKFLWYRYLLEKLPLVNYSALKSIVIHISKMSEMEKTTKMSVEALVTCFAPTLMRTERDVGSNNPATEITVLLDIVSQHDYLFQIAQHERDQEATMKKYVECIRKAQEGRNSQTTGLLMGISMYTYNGDCEMVNTTPATTARDVIDYIIRKRSLASNSCALNEILFKGALVRPLFPKDNILMTTGRWGDWAESVRTGGNVCLCLTTTEVLEKLQQHLDTSRALFGEVKYADSKSKNKFKKTTTEFKQCMLTFYKDSKAKSQLCSWKIEDLTIYMGVDTSRSPPSKFGFTFLMNSPEDRGKNHLFGHCVCLASEEEMYRWVAALLVAQNPEGLLSWSK